jgi:RNA polymerase sigma factor (sigma-70 family)
VPGSSSGDDELARLAQLGDADALGLLLARHLPDMKAVALSVVGFGPDAEDAVQEACLAALERIGDLRHPEAVGAWLRAIVRNACRMQLRKSVAQVPWEAVGELPSAGPPPDASLERHSIGELPEPLQLAAMLRYFGAEPSYEHVAVASGVPVSTVRSRLHKARAELSRALLATADASYGDVRSLTARRHQEEQEMFDAAEKGELGKVVAEKWPPGLEVYVRSARRPGIAELVVALEADLQAGLRPRVVRTIASRDVTIWENEMTYTDGRAGTAWLLLHEGKSGRLRLYPPLIPLKECQWIEEPA